MSAGNYVIDDQGEIHRHYPDVLATKPVRRLRAYAEKLNARAITGFVSLLALEVLTGHSLIGALASLSQL